MKNIKNHVQELKKIDSQRKSWLILSAFVTAMISVIILHWTEVTNTRLLWVIASCGLLVAMVWWYWTMRLIRQLIDHRIEESKILQDIVLDIKDIKKEVKETMLEIIDKSK